MCGSFRFDEDFIPQVLQPLFTLIFIKFLITNLEPTLTFTTGVLFFLFLINRNFLFSLEKTRYLIEYSLLFLNTGDWFGCVFVLDSLLWCNSFCGIDVLFGNETSALHVELGILLTLCLWFSSVGYFGWIRVFPFLRCFLSLLPILGFPFNLIKLFVECISVLFPS